MAHIFLALENPKSMLGYTKKNENFPKRDEDFVKPRFTFELEKEKPTRGQADQAAALRKKKYQDRADYIEKKGIDPFSVDQTRKDDRVVAEDFCKLEPNARMAQAGSLVTLIKTMIWYKEKGCKFHTVAFLGHGNTDIMAVGTGRAGLGEEATKVFDAEKRQITVANSDIWKIYFLDAAKQGCFVADADGSLHVFLLGCLTGASEGPESVTNVVATTLHDTLDMPVVAYGPTASVDGEDTRNILTHLAAIKLECATQESWFIGDFETTPRPKDDPLKYGGKYLRSKRAG